MTDRTDQRARMLAGRCLCSTVHYVVADEFRYAANCHCTDCRRTTGSAFKPFAGIEREKFSVTKGADHLHTYGEEKAHDARCGKCGSFLYSVVRDGAYVHVALGPLANEPTIRPSEHIFVGSKAPWFTITDDLPQYRAHVADGPPMNR
ncbi:GFA family protein [Sinorhizobium fredii]|uniref:GFA family protein n=1 Tax=Rhizobium fredii TaxID=380 RepID=UPI00055B271D|nr:GFA family protein [Sinorhizobium fredii]